MSTILSKKELRAQVSEKLHEVFASLKSELGHKKFEKNVKRASKNLVDGIKDEEEEVVADKKPETGKKAAPKKAAKKSVPSKARPVTKKVAKKASTRKK